MLGQGLEIFNVSSKSFNLQRRIDKLTFMSREHLKRKHYPVHCPRCFKVFSARDRASALNDLIEHGRSTTQCEVMSASLKEGISDAQWAQLEKKKSNKKDQETSTVEKWYEIWKILFPEVPEEARPETPCKIVRTFIFLCVGG